MPKMRNINCKSKNKTKVFVKPILNYEQIVELIDNRISEIERASEQISVRKIKNLARKNKETINK